MSKKKTSLEVTVDPLLTRPKSVAIVCLGPSMPSYIRTVQQSAGMKRFDETWACNRAFSGVAHDKLFCMDDLRWLDTKRDKVYASALKEHDKPIITSTAYPEFPQACPYPLGPVMEFLDDDLFAVNTVSYMVAYAIYIGVQEIALYGADFVYGNGNIAESGGMAVAYLLGRCKEYGIVHTLPGDTTMIYANKVQQRPDGSIGRELYGYHRVAEMEKDTAMKTQQADRAEQTKKDM